MSLDSLFDTLQNLGHGLRYSRIAFDIPDSGLAGLSTLVLRLSEALNALKDSAADIEPEGLTQTELQYAAQATYSAGCAAVAAGEAAEVAAEASARARQELSARKAVQGALSAASSAFRAAGAAQEAARSAISMPPEARLPYDRETVDQLIAEAETFEHLYRFLFNAGELQLESSLFSGFPLRARMDIEAVAAALWDRLLHIVQIEVEDPTVPDPLLDLLKALRSGNSKLQARLREYGLSSAAFRDPEFLRKLQAGEIVGASELGMDQDASLRAKNMAAKPELFRDVSQEDQEAEDYSGYEVASGKTYGNANEEMLSFPGKINGMALKPLIDTGGACNLVRAEWLKDHGVKFDEDSQSTSKLLMADGSQSEGCPHVSVNWSFDSRKKLWTEVEFVVVKNFHYDALIGLPFLKLTQTIHNSEGQLCFPEFRGTHAEKDAIPLYDMRVQSST